MSASTAILERLPALHPKRDRPLARTASSACSPRSAIRERQLPPVVHVAGTNGKGSTIAYPARDARGGRLARARLHLAASGALQRAHRGCAGRRQTRFGRGAGRGARGVRARQRRRADHLLRDHHRGGVAALLAQPGRRAAARGRARRTARRDQRGRAPLACVITPVSIDHLEFLGDTLEKIAAEKAASSSPACRRRSRRNPTRCWR